MATQQHVNFQSSPYEQDQWLELVRRQVDSVGYGVVQIVIHDSRVVQIERTEKVRLDRQTTENRHELKSPPTRL